MPADLPPRLGRRAALAAAWLAAGLTASPWAWGNDAAAAAADPPGSSLPALAAQFRVTLSRPGQARQTQTWQITRSHSLITWLKGPGTEELWRRDRSGIRLERVMRSDRHVIEYSAGELRALDVVLDWGALATLFPADQLKGLRPLASPARAGPVLHLRGHIGQEQVDLLWDPAAQLPVRLARSGPQGQVLFERIALHAQAPAAWPQAGAGLDDFQRVDASDFGDMAYNPVVRKAHALDQRAGWRRTHAD